MWMRRRAGHRHMLLGLKARMGMMVCPMVSAMTAQAAVQEQTDHQETSDAA